MSLPVLGLLVERLPDPALTPLLVELRHWCRPAMYAADVEGVAAWLVMSPALRLPDNRPFAVWAADDAELARYPVDVIDRARAVLSPADVLEGVAVNLVKVPPGTAHLGASPALTPFVRQRWRRRFGLPEELTVVLTDDDGAIANDVAIPRDIVPTAVMLASVVVADHRRELEALACGSPCVVDTAAARSVLADDSLAARLGYNGRRSAEESHDLHRVARRVARHLELEGPADPLERLDLRLDELETPAASRVRDRVADAIAHIVGADQ